ncbi:GNAT family N-acetyltransferase [Halobacillus shinanisalinarum]|uniref:GNAT family N-acetyltransferase n=1 Tax=Halobacillus shinanisalinarum TaxID=2932258 RepID=UPI0037BF2B90
MNIIIYEGEEKGYGTRLMQRIYEIANERGIREIELDYWLENQGVKNFYEKEQFTKYREVVRKSL